MSNIPTISELIQLLAFIIPGFVSFQIMRLFAVNIAREARDFVLIYVTLSAVNLAICGWMFSLEEISRPDFLKSYTWPLFVFIIPALSGAILGVFIQKEGLGWLFSKPPLNWTGITPVKRVPTAWDWKFGNTEPQFVLITLKDGTEYAGLLGTDSYASSEMDERDLFIEELYTKSEDEDWLLADRSLYVAKNEIRTIEFIKQGIFSDAKK